MIVLIAGIQISRITKIYLCISEILQTVGLDPSGEVLQIQSPGL